MASCSRERSAASRSARTRALLMRSVSHPPRHLVTRDHHAPTIPPCSPSSASPASSASCSSRSPRWPGSAQRHLLYFPARSDLDASPPRRPAARARALDRPLRRLHRLARAPPRRRRRWPAPSCSTATPGRRSTAPTCATSSRRPGSRASTSSSSSTRATGPRAGSPSEAAIVRPRSTRSTPLGTGAPRPPRRRVARERRGGAGGGGPAGGGGAPARDPVASVTSLAAPPLPVRPRPSCPGRLPGRPGAPALRRPGGVPPGRPGRGGLPGPGPCPLRRLPGSEAALGGARGHPQRAPLPPRGSPLERRSRRSSWATLPSR